MFKEIVNVDENIEKKLRKDKNVSWHALNDGIEMWGRRALDYLFSDAAPLPLQIELEEGGAERTNSYGKMIDRKAAELRETMEKKLFAMPTYKLTGEYLKDVQKRNAVKSIIDEQIYAELIYVKELVRE